MIARWRARPQPTTTQWILWRRVGGVWKLVLSCLGSEQRDSRKDGRQNSREECASRKPDAYAAAAAEQHICSLAAATPRPACRPADATYAAAAAALNTRTIASNAPLGTGRGKMPGQAGQSMWAALEGLAGCTDCFRGCPSVPGHL